MGRFLLVGIGPLPFEDTALPLGPGLRTWHFASVLHDGGHIVRLLTLRPWERVDLEQPGCAHRAGLEEFRLPFNPPGTCSRLDALCAEFRPDAIFGVTVPAAVRAVHLPSVPFWADVFGDYLAEAQLKAVRSGEDSVVRRWQSELTQVLMRADKLSAVSRRQAWALAGQLGTVGRLRSRTVGYEFVRAIPCAVPDGDIRMSRRAENPATGDSVTALWAGSFNTWCDVTTFAAGTEAALVATAGLRIEVTGGAIPGHDDDTFDEFRSLVAESRGRDRFVLHGWVEREALEAAYARADLGISLSRWSYERELGSENRLVGMLGRGIPVIASAGTELAEEVGHAGAGLIIPPGSARAFYEALRALSLNRERRLQMAHAAHVYARQRLSYSATASPLLEWAERPHPAPDHEPW